MDTNIVGPMTGCGGKTEETLSELTLIVIGTTSGVNLVRNHLKIKVFVFIKINLFLIYTNLIIGASKKPKAQNYCGPSPASEPEIQAIQKYILSLSRKIIGFDVHSFGQLILRNYSWTQELAPNENITSILSNHMAAQMESLYNVTYQPIPAINLYRTSGGSTDWMYFKAGIPGFGIELRDQGELKFLIPNSQIIPTGMELYIGIISAVSFGT